MITTSFNKSTLFEVLWEGKSVGVYQTEQEAENIAENYALGSLKYPEPKKPRPFDNYDLFTCLLFACLYKCDNDFELVSICNCRIMFWLFCLCRKNKNDVSNYLYT